MDNETALLAILDAAEQDEPKLMEALGDELDASMHEQDGLADEPDEARTRRVEEQMCMWIRARLAEKEEDGR